MKILIVDDEPLIVAGIEALLEYHGLPSVGVGDASEAERRIAEEFFPVILADLRVRSEEDGLHLLEAVQRISPQSRVASITGHADAATEQRLRERGVRTILRKPVEEEVLISALREMLAAVETTEHASNVDDDALYAATIGTLHSIARRRFGFDDEDARDLVQETWLLFLEKRAAIRTPKAWLTGAIANLCRQRIDRRVRDRERSAEIVDIGRTFATDDTLAVQQALGRLDDRSRSLCTLIGLEQHSYDEVSEALGIPLGSVGPLYMRAKTKLREAIAA